MRVPRGPREDAERNERIAEGNLARGAPVAKGRTGGNALAGGQTEPAVPRDPEENKASDDA